MIGGNHTGLVTGINIIRRKIFLVPLIFYIFSVGDYRYAQAIPQMFKKRWAVSFSVKYKGEPGKQLIRIKLLLADSAIGQLKQPGSRGWNR